MKFKNYLLLIGCMLYLIIGGFLFVLWHSAHEGTPDQTAAAIPAPIAEEEQLEETTLQEPLQNQIEADPLLLSEDEDQPEEALFPELPKREPLEKYKELLSFNPYVSGWLKIDGTAIDSPVVYTPKSQNYFLHRTIDGKDAECGTFFIADIWRDEYHNTLIYGHNMADGRSFGSLQKYADPSYGMNHSLIHFDTLYDEQEYELVAAFYSQIADEAEMETDEERQAADERVQEEGLAKKQEEMAAEEEKKEESQKEGSPSEEPAQNEPSDQPAPAPPVEEIPLTLADLDLYEDFGDVDIYRYEKDNDNERFRYYYYTDLSDPADFAYFAEHVKQYALYDTGVDLEWGDELLTLSTCSYHVPNGRFVVVARKKR